VKKVRKQAYYSVQFSELKFYDEKGRIASPLCTLKNITVMIIHKETRCVNAAEQHIYLLMFFTSAMLGFGTQLVVWRGPLFGPGRDGYPKRYFLVATMIKGHTVTCDNPTNPGGRRASLGGERWEVGGGRTLLGGATEAIDRNYDSTFMDRNLENRNGSVLIVHIKVGRCRLKPVCARTE